MLNTQKIMHIATNKLGCIGISLRRIYFYLYTLNHMVVFWLFVYLFIYFYFIELLLFVFVVTLI